MAMERGDERLRQGIVRTLRGSKRHPVSLRRLQKELARILDSPRPSSVISVLEKMVEEGGVIAFGKGDDREFYLAENVGSVKERLCSLIGAHHRRYPYEPGVAAGEIKKRFSETKTQNTRRNMDPRLFELALSACMR